MKTEIRIEAEITDEQLDCLLSEIKNIAEIIGIKLKVESSKLSQHDVSKSFYCLGDSFGESGKCDKQCEDCKAKILKQ